MLVVRAVRPEEVLVDWLVTVVQEVIVVRLWLPTADVSSSRTADRIRTADRNALGAIRKIVTLRLCALTVHRISYTIRHEAN
jgi:hypothetical protein